MKRKELAQLVVAIVILVVAGYLIYSQLAPRKAASKNSAPSFEVITPINTGFDSTATSFITDTSKNRDFYQQPDLSNGLGNPQLFSSQ